MTVAMLMENTLKAAQRQWESSRNRVLKPLKLNILEKVPSDIEIAMAQTPKPVTQLANELGLLPDEVESYGKYKAKIELSVLDRLAHRKDGKYIIVAGYVRIYLDHVQTSLRSTALHPHPLARVNLRRRSVWLRL